MKKLFLCLSFLLLLSSAFASSSAEPYPMQTVLRDDLYRLLATGADVLVLDLRMTPDYESRHIKGAVSAPMDKAVAGDTESGEETLRRVLLKETGKENGNGHRLVLACYTGHRYAQAATDILASLGAEMDKVYTLDGGNEAWNQSYYCCYVEGTDVDENNPYTCFDDVKEDEEDEVVRLLQGEGDTLDPELLSTVDFSSRRGSPELNLEDAIDILDIKTPCAFESTAEDLGYYADYLSPEKTIESKKNQKEKVMLASDGLYTICYLSGVTAYMKKGTTEVDSPLMSSLPLLSGDNVKVLYTVYDKNLLVIVLKKGDTSSASSYQKKLMESFPIQGQAKTGEDFLSYTGENADGYKVSFLYSNGWKAVAIEK